MSGDGKGQDWSKIFPLGLDMGRPDATNHEPQHRTNLIRLRANGSQASDPPPPTPAKRRRLARAKQRALVTQRLMWHAKMQCPRCRVCPTLTRQTTASLLAWRSRPETIPLITQAIDRVRSRPDQHRASTTGRGSSRYNNPSHGLPLLGHHDSPFGAADPTAARNVKVRKLGDFNWPPNDV